MPRAEAGFERFVPKLDDAADVAAVNTRVLERLLAVRKVHGSSG